MDNLWDFFKGMFDFDFPSPRDAMFNYVIEKLLHPDEVNLTSEDYLNLVQFFLYFAGPLIVIRLVYALYRTAVDQNIQELRDWAIAAAYAMSVVSVAPGLIVAVQYFFNLLGANVFAIVLGGDPEKGLTELQELSGNGGIDLVLSVIQILALFVLALLLQVVVVALVTAAIALLWGLLLNFIRRFGQQIYDLSISISIYGIFGNFIAMVTIAIVVLTGRLIVGSSATSRGFVNTLAIIAAAFVLWGMLKRIGGQIKAVATTVKEGGEKLRRRSNASEDNIEAGGGKKQVAEEAQAQKQHSKHKFISRRSEKASARSDKDGHDKQSGHGRFHPRRSASTRERLRPRRNEQQSGSNRKAKGGEKPEGRGRARSRTEPPSSPRTPQSTQTAGRGPTSPTSRTPDSQPYSISNRKAHPPSGPTNRPRRPTEGGT
jgi:hypothetical protein